MKRFILLMASIALFSSCSSDDSTSVTEQPIDPTPARSYRMMPCFSGCISYNIPSDLLPSDFTVMKKRGNGQWKEQPINSILWVQNSDSVWVRVNKPNGFIPNETNYIDYQVYNKDSLKVDDGNKNIRFDSYNATINRKVKVEFPLYH